MSTRRLATAPSLYKAAMELSVTGNRVAMMELFFLSHQSMLDQVYISDENHSQFFNSEDVVGVNWKSSCKNSSTA